jgi:hypothetical protein
MSIYPRTNYEMTEEDLATLMEACKPVPMIMLQCGNPSSVQDNANRAWAALGKKMGFDGMTVQPREGFGSRFFTAIPSENETQRLEREHREEEEHRKAKIAKLESEISERQCQLDALKSL